MTTRRHFLFLAASAGLTTLSVNILKDASANSLYSPGFKIRGVPVVVIKYDAGKKAGYLVDDRLYEPRHFAIARSRKFQVLDDLTDKLDSLIPYPNEQTGILAVGNWESTKFEDIPVYREHGQHPWMGTVTLAYHFSANSIKRK